MELEARRPRQVNDCSTTVSPLSAKSRTLNSSRCLATAVRPPLDLVSLVRGAGGGGVQEWDLLGRARYAGLTYPSAPSTIDPRWRNFSRRAVALASAGSGQSARMARPSPTGARPRSRCALPVELGEVESHRLVTEVVDRRCAPLSALWLVGHARVQAVRPARRAPEVHEPSDVPSLARRRRFRPKTVEQERLPAQLFAEEPLDDLWPTRSKQVRPALLRGQLRIDLPRVLGVAGVGSSWASLTSSMFDCGHMPPGSGSGRSWGRRRTAVRPRVVD